MYRSGRYFLEPFAVVEVARVLSEFLSNQARCEVSESSSIRPMPWFRPDAECWQKLACRVRPYVPPTLAVAFLTSAFPKIFRSGKFPISTVATPMWRTTAAIGACLRRPAVRAHGTRRSGAQGPAAVRREHTLAALTVPGWSSPRPRRNNPAPA
jgi:hypothetical protein